MGFNPLIDDGFLQIPHSYLSIMCILRSVLLKLLETLTHLVHTTRLDKATKDSPNEDLIMTDCLNSKDLLLPRAFSAMTLKR